MTVKDAEKKLKENNLEISIENEEIDKDNEIIIEQSPTESIKINAGNKVYVKHDLTNYSKQ